jgi:hypothetical protein
MNRIVFFAFILLLFIPLSNASSNEAVPLKYSGKQVTPGTYGDKTVAEYDYLNAYFLVYKDVISDRGNFNKSELIDIVSYYSSANGRDLSYNLDYKGPSGKTIGDILQRAGVKMGRRFGYCYMAMSINLLPCCVDKTLPPGYCYERKTCERGRCVDSGGCSGFVCGDGWCDWEESDPSNACCCEQDCGIPCGGSTTTMPPATTTSGGVTTTTPPSGYCVLPDGSTVPWICGDSICDMTGWPYWYLSENIPFGPCCCEIDCGIPCFGGPYTTTTTSVTTTSMPTGECVLPDGSSVPWVCGDGGCDLVGPPYWYLSENNPFGPCCCQPDCQVPCFNSPTTTVPASTTTTLAVTTTGGATTTTAGSTTTTLTQGGCHIPWDILTDVVCGNGRCDIKTDGREGPFSENEPYSPCCCEQDCPGVTCKFECVDPTSKQPLLPFTCGDGSCVRTDPGAGYTWMDEDNPNGPCCCETDCPDVKCGVSTTTTQSTTSSTKASTTTRYPTTTRGEPTSTSSSSTSSTRTPTTTTIVAETPCDTYKKTGRLPAEFDWRNVNGQDYTTPVKDQADCASCCAYAGLAALEGMYEVEEWNAGLNPDLSEQNLVSCCSEMDCSHCSTSAYDCLKNGIVDEGCLPYASTKCGFPRGMSGDRCTTSCTCAGNGKCANPCDCSGKCADWKNRIWSISDYQYIMSSGTEAVKAKMICTGPIVTGVDATDWLKYGPDCGNTAYPQADHVVAITGYSNSGGYWIIKNSWGSAWNGDGYFKVKYGKCATDTFIYFEGLKHP